jgi:hypothetical protein
MTDSGLMTVRVQHIDVCAQDDAGPIDGGVEAIDAGMDASILSAHIVARTSVDAGGYRVELLAQQSLTTADAGFALIGVEYH